jgi:hypothetical protein
MERPDTKELKRTSRVITIAAISGLALMGCSADPEAPNNREQKNEQTSPTPDQAELTESLPTVQEMVCDDELKSKPGTVVVDGRCDNDPSAPVGLYGEPNQLTDALASAVTGTVLRAECLESGDLIQDASGAGSEKWVRFDFGAAYNELDILTENVGGGDIAYIPEAWVDGDERLQNC